MVHHPAYRDSFVASNPVEHAVVGLDLGPLRALRPIAPILIVAAFVLPIEAVIVAVMTALHGVVWTLFHRQMHRPARANWTRWPIVGSYYRWVEVYHRAHHDRPRTHFNALAPGADWLFGTL